MLIVVLLFLFFDWKPIIALSIYDEVCYLAAGFILSFISSFSLGKAAAAGVYSGPGKSGRIFSNDLRRLLIWPYTRLVLFILR